MVSHHRYYGQTDNPSVRIGPEDSSTHLRAVLSTHPITITNTLICVNTHVIYIDLQLKQTSKWCKVTRSSLKFYMSQWEKKKQINDAAIII